MSNSFRYISPRGETITFGGTRPYLWKNSDAALLSNMVTAVTRRAPGQRGSTIIDALAGSRTAPLEVRVSTDSNTDMWEQRDTLARVLAVDPASSDETFKLGLLQLFRDGRVAVETDVLPIESPRELTVLNAGTFDAVLEFMSDNGLWRECLARTSAFEISGTGLALPANMPFDIVANAATQDIDIGSHVRTPFRVRFHGLVEEPRLRNLTTGQVIHVTGSVPAGEHVEVDTETKTVTLVTASGATSILDRWAWGSASFWQLLPGVNAVSYESNAGSGSASVTWHPRYSGV